MCFGKTSKGTIPLKNGIQNTMNKNKALLEIVTDNLSLLDTGFCGMGIRTMEVKFTL